MSSKGEVPSFGTWENKTWPLWKVSCFLVKHCSVLSIMFSAFSPLQVGFNEYVDRFEECKVDGDLLLQMTDEDLVDSIKMTPGMVRRRFVLKFRAG